MSLDADLAGARSPNEVLAWSRALLEPALRDAVEQLPGSIRRLAGYHFGWWDADGSEVAAPTPGGKAIRPALTLLSAEAVCGDAERALPAAVAVELVHNFSLIQDDLIDGDLTRRHRPTVWSVFGNGPAIVASDALLALAFQLVSQSGAHPGPSEILSEAAFELMDGQHADLAFEQRSDVGLTECLRMARGKSGSLLGCACALGAAYGGASGDQVTRLNTFGQQLGVAFQLADDMLGIWGDPAVTGKPVHSDLVRRKKSLPLVAALTSGTPAAAELSELYHRDRPLTDQEAAYAAELVERAGGRHWCRNRVGELLDSGLRLLNDTLGAERRAVTEIAQLARHAGNRDR